MTPGSAFPQTRWSMVLAARTDEAPGSREALAELCEQYWYPLYAFLRRRGNDRDRALDLTQGFFGHLLEKKTLSALRPGSGRFRSFLLSSIKNFAANERVRENTQRRGGDTTLLSLDGDRAERRYDLEPGDDWTPDRSFERSWALTVVDGVHERLRGELVAAGKQRLFDLLSPALSGEGRPQREVADELGISEAAVKMSLMRLRKRFGRLLRDEIAHTVRNEADVDDELRHLLAVLRDG